MSLTLGPDHTTPTDALQSLYNAISQHWDCPTFFSVKNPGCECEPCMDVRMAMMEAEMILGRPCEHEWTDARNEAITSGEICLKCNTVRSGNAASEAK